MLGRGKGGGCGGEVREGEVWGRGKGGGCGGAFIVRSVLKHNLWRLCAIHTPQIGTLLATYA